jgi:signal peptidase I
MVLTALTGPGVGHFHLGFGLRGLGWMATTPVFVAASATHAEALGGRIGFDLVVPILLGGPLAIWLSSVIDIFVVGRRGARVASVVAVVAAALASLVVGAGMAFGVDAFVLEAFRVPSTSMMPTLAVGDHIMVDKRAELSRGDVVVFVFPEDPRQVYVKRVIGLPGDSVSFAGSTVLVNGVALTRCVLGPVKWIDDRPREATLALERHGDQAYLTQEEARPDAPVSRPVYAVKEGELFVMGDNRNNSHDSRFWFGGQGGGVPFARVKGRALFRWASQRGEETRHERVGTSLGVPMLPAGTEALGGALGRCLGGGAVHPRG